MEGAFLIEISKRIRKCRTDLRLTVQELASKSGVTKGLISQIENGRSIPSLPVLFSIIKSLEVPIGDFFADIAANLDVQPVIVKRKSEYEPFQKEDATGFFYERVMVKNIASATIDIVLLRLEPGSKRNKVETEAFEYKYIISGSVCYQINGHEYDLHAGDSLFFDGRQPHVPNVIGNEPAIMLIVYFFESE